MSKGKRKQRHFDNKDDILKRMREVEKVQKRADHAVAASWSAFMMFGILTLYEDLNFRDKRINKFIDGMRRRHDEWDSGELPLDEVRKRLYDKAGVIVEE